MSQLDWTQIFLHCQYWTLHAMSLWQTSHHSSNQLLYVLNQTSHHLSFSMSQISMSLYNKVINISQLKTKSFTALNTQIYSLFSTHLNSFRLSCSTEIYLTKWNLQKCYDCSVEYYSHNVFKATSSAIQQAEIEMYFHTLQHYLHHCSSSRHLKSWLTNHYTLTYQNLQ